MYQNPGSKNAFLSQKLKNQKGSFFPDRAKKTNRVFPLWLFIWRIFGFGFLLSAK
jgi:hypothetical protein